MAATGPSPPGTGAGRDPGAAAGSAAAAGVLGADTGLERLWRRLAQPVDPTEAAHALCGLLPGNARQLLGVALAASPEADALLDGMGRLLRSLAVSTTSRPLRCEGEIRGPVLWSETMAARAASPGAGGVFICASPRRAFDTDENRVLVAALGRIVRAARAADPPEAGPVRPPKAALRRARANGDRARRALEHRSLAGVPRGHVTGRMLHRTRTSTKAANFRPAVAVVQRSWAEHAPVDLAPYVDADLAAEHRLAADVLDVLDAREAIGDGRLRIVDGVAVAGPFAYAARVGVTVAGRRITDVLDV